MLNRPPLEFYIDHRDGKIVMWLGGERFKFRDAAEARLIAKALVFKADEIEGCSGVDGHADSERAQSGRA